MANRFTDTEKWDDPWFCSLSLEHKLFWNYLCDRCNHAGIWKVNWPLVKFYIGIDKIDQNVFNGRIKVLSGEEWFIEKAILFQQKISSLNELNPKNPCHLSIIKILTLKNVLSPSQAPLKPLPRGQGIGIGKGKVNKGVFDSIWEQYPLRVGRKEADRHFKASVKTEKDLTAIQVALDNYKKSARVMTGHIQNGSTWFNNWQDWIELPENEKFCEKCKNTGKYMSSTGYESTCNCPAGKRLK